MSLDWQNAIVLLAVTAAGAYLARAVWQTLRRRNAVACGACAKCPAGESPGPIVGISPREQSE